MPFEVFNKRMAPLAKAPSVTIQKRGTISINRVAHKMIEEAATVELLFDPEAHVIALRPSTESHAYPIRNAQRGSGQTQLSATAFTQYYGIDTEVSRRYEPYLEDGMLCINLDGKSVEVTSNRAKRKPDAPEEELLAT